MLQIIQYLINYFELVRFYVFSLSSFPYFYDWTVGEVIWKISTVSYRFDSSLAYYL